MLKLFAIICLLTTAAFARANDAAQVSGVINGKQLKLSPEVRQKLAGDSIALLASCGYWSDLDCTTKHQRFADAKKGSYLLFAFAKPPTVGVSVSKGIEIRVEVDEMVITLPMSSGVVWVRTGQRTSYFAFFQPAATFKLEAALKEAQMP